MKVERQEISPAWAKVPEAARYAGVSSRLVRRWIAEQLLPRSRMPSGLVLVRLQDVDELLLHHRDGADISEKIRGTKSLAELKNRAEEIAHEIITDMRR
jgi:excisionase family DNA binding protein